MKTPFLIFCLLFSNFALASAEERLMEALQERDKEAFKEALSEINDIKSFSVDGKSILHFAVAIQDLTLIKDLVEAGADINGLDTDQDNSTVLHIAVVYEDPKIVDYLIEQGANIDARSYNEGKTILQLACEFGSLANVALLLDRGADVKAKDNRSRTALHSACSREDSRGLEIVKLLLARGAEVDVPAMYPDDDGYVEEVEGVTALYLAIGRPMADIAKILIENGADTGLTLSNGETILHAAAYGGDRKLVLDLVNKGFSAEVKDQGGRTPFHLAVMGDSVEAAIILMAGGACVNTQNSKGNTALHFAAKYCRVKVLPFLLNKKNIDLNILNAEGMTAFCVAIASDNYRIAKQLWDANVDPNTRAVGKDSAIHYLALRLMNEKRVTWRSWCLLFKRMIGSNKFDLNIRGLNGETVLYRAMNEMHKGLVLELLANGANPNIKLCKNITAVQLLFSQFLSKPNRFCYDPNASYHISSRHQMDRDMKDLMKALLEAGAKINQEDLKDLVAKGINGRFFNDCSFTALHWAVDNLFVSLVKALLVAGASPHVRLWYSEKTPLRMAQEKKASRKNLRVDSKFQQNISNNLNTIIELLKKWDPKERAKRVMKELIMQYNRFSTLPEKELKALGVNPLYRLERAAFMELVVKQVDLCTLKGCRECRK